MTSRAPLTLDYRVKKTVPFLIAFILSIGIISAAHAQKVAVQDKTLVAWVSLANLTQRGGSVLTIDDQHGHFDGIVFGELSPAKWMAGSEFWHRTSKDQASWPEESAAPNELVQLAAVYKGKQVALYRNGKEYARHEIAQPQAFDKESAVVFGYRHLGPENRDGCFAGSIADARIYNAALSQEQIAALKPKELSDSKPLAWWNFANDKAKDAMGSFPTGKLVGNACIKGGKLLLDGSSAMTVAAQRPAGPRYDSPLHYRPKVGALADTIPFFWKGQYHIFYLRAGVGKVPWEHIVSSDLIHWKELPSALLPDGDPDGPDGQNMFTGCVIENDGVFHMFYTGDNQRNKQGAECIMHATSSDLTSWTKHPKHAFYADGVTYQNGGFRDPYVFWNEEAKAFWMILCAHSAKEHRPVQGVAESTDLVTWKQIEPLIYDPIVNAASECPDLFKIGDTWYIIHSPSKGTTDVRFSKDIRGPYRFSPTPAIDTSILYAAKRLFDGKRHVITGWIRDLGGSRDNGRGEWGGDQCMPREVYAGPNGQLYFRPIPEATALFNRVIFSSAKEPTLNNLPSSIETPDNYLLECKVQLDPRAEFTVAMRQEDPQDPEDKDNSGYRLILRPGKQAAEIASSKFYHPRKVDIDFSKPVKISAFVQGSIIECFINDAYAFSCRAYEYRTGKLKMSVTGGQAKVTDVTVKTYEAPVAQ